MGRIQFGHVEWLEGRLEPQSSGKTGVLLISVLWILAFVFTLLVGSGCLHS